MPEGVPELISQRRRWLNGSLFAAFYSIIHWHRLWNTDHSLFQKLLFQVQFLYNLVNIFFTWFSLVIRMGVMMRRLLLCDTRSIHVCSHHLLQANFYLIFFYLTQIFATPDSLLGTAGPWIFEVFRQLYIFAIVIIFIVSLGNRPQGRRE